MPKGRGYGNLLKGERIVFLPSLEVGTIILEYSEQFDAENTIKVTKILDNRVYVRFVNPLDTDDFMGPEFCIWDFDLMRTKLWYAETPKTKVTISLPAEAVQRLAELSPEKLKELSQILGIKVLDIRRATLASLEEQMSADDPAASMQMEWEAEPMASLRAAITEAEASN